MEDEADWLRQRGLGERVTPKDLLVFGDEGLIDNELRFENECVRHKTLDLIGDLALAGCELVGQFIAYKSGHRLNAELVKVLLDGRTQGERDDGGSAVDASELTCHWPHSHPTAIVDPRRRAGRRRRDRPFLRDRAQGRDRPRHAAAEQRHRSWAA